MTCFRKEGREERKRERKEKRERETEGQRAGRREQGSMSITNDMFFKGSCLN